MAKVENIEKVLAVLRTKAAQAKQEDGVSVVVGYTQAYGIYVHENREAYHKVGRAGFLLDVMRELSRELANIVRTGLKRGLTLTQSLLLAGLRLQRESQLNVPVDTGALKASAFTRVEKG